MIDVKEEDDGTFTISWDENDPNEAIFNTWTQEDFINLLTNYLNSLQESGVLDDIGGEEVLAESVNEVTEYFIDQSAEEVNQDINTLHDWYKVKEEAIREYQDNELKEERTLPPPDNFPLFP